MVETRPLALRQIRADLQFDLDDVAKAVGIKPERLSSFEAGDRLPTIKQLQRLAAVYGVEPYHLSFGRRPNTLELPADFRRADRAKAKLSVSGYKAFLFGRRITSFIGSVASVPGSNLPNSPFKLPKYPDPEDLAADFAKTIRFKADEYWDKKSPASAFRYIRACTEKSGTSILSTWYDHSDFRGFYYRYYDTTPAIMLHTRGWDKKSLLFTLAHEICHLLLDQEGISDPKFSKNATELYCNKFAASLLGPQNHIHWALSHTQVPRDDIERFVRNVAAKTLLSQYATAIRLLELGVITKAQFKEWRAGRVSFGDPKGGFGGDGDPPNRAEMVLPHYGYLTALALGVAQSGGFAEPYEIALATGIGVQLQSEIVREASEQLDEMGIA
jgi:Zn-dependent peptidase ImmA (M78 family)/transcriptional regulator with XRE-family HTH domain